MTPQDMLFGEVAVALRLLTREQLNHCLAKQRQDPTRRLGEICLAERLLDESSLERVLAQQEVILRRRRTTVSTGAAEPAAAPLRATAPLREVVTRASVTETPQPRAVASEASSTRDLGTPPAAAIESPTREAAIDPPRESASMRSAASSPATALASAPPTFAARPSLMVAAAPPIPLDPSAVPPPPPIVAPAPAPASASTRPGLGAALGLVRPSPSSSPRIDALLRRLIELGGSDLHLSVGSEPVMRIHGKMQRVGGFGVFDANALGSMLLEIIDERSFEEFERSADADFAHTIKGLARFRANYFVDRHGIGAVFRQIPIEILTPDRIGLPPAVLDLCSLTKGLVLVTGPTGSGKSTTLASLVDYINRNRDDHIITIEDPIEFVHESKRCLVNQREVGRHTKSFKSALRAALREDPDIVLVGEMRDLETIAIALETAETGHLVFGTLHTTTAPGTVDRIIDQFPGDQQAQIRTMLADALRGVIGQTLLRRKGGGRVAAYEILFHTSAISNLIREGKTFQLRNTMQVSRHLGMQTLNDHLLELVQKDLVDAQEAYLKAVDKQNLRKMFERAGILLEVAEEP